MLRLLFIYGTRPEAIKLAPLILDAARRPGLDVRLCSTGQHKEMLDSVSALFGLQPQHDLALMTPGQSLSDFMAAALLGAGLVIDAEQPDWVIVQGDTTSAFAGALAAFHRKVRVAHVEAGLRTGNLLSPWPEEGNRRLITPLAQAHFAPTAVAAANLRREAVSDKAIAITGNSVIDALHRTVGLLDNNEALTKRIQAALPALNPARRLILVTGHRRENFDGGLASLCRALHHLALRGDIDIVYPVHLNPIVQKTAGALLGDHPNIHLIPPLDYAAFVHLMRRAHVILTDSGGIQEEAPALGIPVLVVRDTTERPEAISSGTARLVGTSETDIVQQTSLLLDDETAHATMAKAVNPFGDGKASQRILDWLIAHHQSQ
jgi:UDP-N-acetylglucosamine 2-epimerase